MRQNIHIIKSTINEQGLQLHTEVSLKGLEPTGQIIVDSDNLSFIYLAETEENYAHIRLEENVWEDVKEALEKELSVFVVHDHESLELESFQEELSYLIENIEGNGNYGEEMVSRVESVFLPKG
ncbi:hypothetical protein [Rossellomorea sp. BNER]|uniref:UPF0738 family protein n=1 Tax=Rossellomorea sp. BNER TaxID=2962031 RepID=UPI003AF246A6|nr:hypothetical protein [Rossellomorea sp. BNER]